MRLTPPAWFLLAIVLMVILHFALPVGRWLPWPWRLLGLPPLATGLVITVLTDQQFKRAQTTVKPFEESRTLITEGLFRISRHPMYAGMTLAVAGIALLLGSGLPWFGVVLFALLMDRRFIVREEAMLRARFGEAYETYARRVRRWL
jgi:protein-S-isoprenylcysteine O-methyltransferase Ste14